MSNVTWENEILELVLEEFLHIMAGKGSISLQKNTKRNQEDRRKTMAGRSWMSRDEGF